jgi:hypothetical protein
MRAAWLEDERFMSVRHFYLSPLEFTLKRGSDADTNCVVSRGDADLMLETAADHYGDEYNAAIRKRQPGRGSSTHSQSGHGGSRVHGRRP